MDGDPAYDPLYDPLYDVAVVGLGPVGSLLALLLGRQGRRVLAIDRDAVAFPLPRAIATDDEVLRILRALPDGDAIVDAMLLDTSVEFVGRDGRMLTRLRFPGSGPSLPGLATFHQPTLERQLDDRLAAHPCVDVRRGVALGSLSASEDAVELQLTDVGADGGTLARARYVVGCDGAGSVVRRHIAARLRGRRFEEPWLVVDAAPDPYRDGTDGGGARSVRFTCRPERPTVELPMPGGRRWEFLLRPHEVADADRPEHAHALLRDSGWDPDRVRVARNAVYRYSAGTADRWREGRILLAGDAAHLMPPFAGQGLSAGLRDASALGWRLGLVLAGAAPRLLDDYQRERHRHVRAMTRLALFVGGVVQTRHPTLARLRDGTLRAADRCPGVGSWLRAGGPRPEARLPRPWGRRRHRAEGRLLPAVYVRGAAGSPVLLDGLLGTGHALIAEADALAGLPRAAREAWERLGATRVVVAPAGQHADGDPRCRTVSTADPALRRLLRGGRVLVVRPDRYLAGAVRFADLPAFTRRYMATLGRPLPGGG